MRPYGDRAVLLEVADADEAMDRYRAIRALPAEDRQGLVDVVPAARTVLLSFADAASCARSARRLADVPPAPPTEDDEHVVRIPVVYDGADLVHVADLVGVSADEVIRRHSESRYRVAFIGFAPGFAYLTGLDPLLHVPRRESPRTSVPAGSVAIAGEYGAVYPTSSPGGWQLLGRTDAPVFDARRDPPALLRPGSTVRFEAVRG